MNNPNDNLNIINLRPAFNNNIKVGDLLKIKICAIDGKPTNILRYGIVYEVDTFTITIIPANKSDSNGKLEKMVISSQEVYFNRLELTIIKEGDL